MGGVAPGHTLRMVQCYIQCTVLKCRAQYRNRNHSGWAWPGGRGSPGRGHAEGALWKLKTDFSQSSLAQLALMHSRGSSPDLIRLPRPLPWCQGSSGTSGGQTAGTEQFTGPAACTSAPAHPLTVIPEGTGQRGLRANRGETRG